MARRFEGQTAFVTGASSGIGAELGRAFAREGANVVLAARRLDALRSVCSEIERGGGKAVPVECDVTDAESVNHAVSVAVESCGGIHVAIANAGIGINGVFTRLSVDDFRRQFETNFFGVLNTVYAVLPNLEKTRGRLGVVSSVMGRVGLPASTAYCSSKFAVCGLAESLYFDLASRGISVTCINPGIVDSNIRRTDNQGRIHEGRKDPAPAFLIVPTPSAARQIVNALYRRQFEAVITGHGKLVCFLARHLPRTVRFIVGRATGGNAERIEKAKRASG